MKPLLCKLLVSDAFRDQLEELLEQTEERGTEQGGILCRRKKDQSLEMRKGSSVGRQSMSFGNLDCNKLYKGEPYEMLGSIHTHPGDSPIPSEADIATAIRNKHKHFCIISTENRLLRCYTGFEELQGSQGDLTLKINGRFMPHYDEWERSKDSKKRLKILDATVVEALHEFGVKDCRAVLD